MISQSRPRSFSRVSQVAMVTQRPRPRVQGSWSGRWVPLFSPSRLRPHCGEAEGVGRGSPPSHRWVGSRGSIPRYTLDPPHPRQKLDHFLRVRDRGSRGAHACLLLRWDVRSPPPSAQCISWPGIQAGCDGREPPARLMSVVYSGGGDPELPA